jgi:hypothetical protein
LRMNRRLIRAPDAAFGTERTIIYPIGHSDKLVRLEQSGRQARQKE